MSNTALANHRVGEARRHPVCCSRGDWRQRELPGRDGDDEGSPSTCQAGRFDPNGSLDLPGAGPAEVFVLRQMMEAIIGSLFAG